MKRVGLLTIALVSMLIAVDPWTGTVGPVHWWVALGSNLNI